MSRALPITGATGKQGGSSPSATRLAAKSPSIKLIQGDLNDVPALFAAARQAAAPAALWGVYSVQALMGRGVTLESEVRQGKARVDEAV
ncbi:putative -like family protein [Neofusicoccum parvum UCRNP2]|uniref:Putative-like family protein n=1 Tax=Botryosphaeria parva (strain UCR-NP2) TaxID=1287680 RepID=R1EUJ5_BOTPV|nr:putative -like family protein [Neofusicoccum parvum UCRNP2]